MKTEIFTDGACRGNPGPGGWGAILRYGDTEKRLNGSAADTTNNRMELLAAIEALAALTRPSEVQLTTDSKYLQDGITKWVAKWKLNGWKTSNKQVVKNKDLWERLDKLAMIHTVDWHWVKGHSGHRDNELADQLANAAIDKMMDEQ
ncbi:MAG: ribonuclease HI [Pseudomonadales bacterium]|jgi:ribonuclease HI|nr:ribonuclease HI [Pseudomonadales bacterium]